MCSSGGHASFGASLGMDSSFVILTLNILFLNRHSLPHVYCRLPHFHTIRVTKNMQGKNRSLLLCK